MASHLHLLPGLDGTGRLFRGFTQFVTATNSTRVLPLPVHTKQDYESLANEIANDIGRTSPTVVVAESFSGPIAIKIASRYPDSVIGVVLVATFVTPPVPKVAKFAPWEFLFRVPLPGFAARRFMLGASASDELVQALQLSVRETPVEVLAQRVRTLTSLDARKELAALKCPAMYLSPTHDRLIPKRCIDDVRQAKPDIEVHKIDGPHLILQQEPRAAWNRIVEFLQGLA